MDSNNVKPINLLDEGTLRKYIKDTVRSTLDEMLLYEIFVNSRKKFKYKT